MALLDELEDRLEPLTVDLDARRKDDDERGKRDQQGRDDERRIRPHELLCLRDGRCGRRGSGHDKARSGVHVVTFLRESLGAP
jgi:hypothetical protein